MGGGGRACVHVHPPPHTHTHGKVCSGEGSSIAQHHTSPGPCPIPSLSGHCASPGLGPVPGLGTIPSGHCTDPIPGGHHPSSGSGHVLALALAGATPTTSVHRPWIWQALCSPQPCAQPHTQPWSCPCASPSPNGHCAGPVPVPGRHHATLALASSLHQPQPWWAPHQPWPWSQPQHRPCTSPSPGGHRGSPVPFPVSPAHCSERLTLPQT